MHTFLQDIRYAARQLMRSRTTLIVAILTLAIGIGANMSVFGLVNAGSSALVRHGFQRAGPRRSTLWSRYAVNSFLLLTKALASPSGGPG